MPPRLTGLQIGGAPEPWAALGFAVRDGETSLGGVRLHFGPDEPPGLSAWTWDAALPASLDGVRTARAAPPRAGVAHPNGALALDHVVLATPDVPRTRAALDAAGLDFRRERDGGAVRQAFYLAGPCLVEVAGPAERSGGGPASLWGLVAVVRDLEALAARLGDRLGATRDAVQPGRRIATVRREAGHGVRLAFMTPRGMVAKR